MADHLALLLSDVVESTRLNVELGDDVMRGLWEEHDRAARALIREWRGREVARSDGFLLLFGDAQDAIGFADAYHLALSSFQPPLFARIGIHAGDVVLRENSLEDIAQGAPALEVDGVALPIAARVMSIARGGQTLMTAASAAAGQRSSTDARSHGYWRLKGLTTPIEIFEVGGHRADFSPPPDSDKAYRVVQVGDLWLPRREVRTTLPAERDGFVGRAAFLQRLADLFEDGARHVSIVGTAGAGKTRLATRFGWTCIGDFPGGVWFCDLAQAHSLDGLVHAVALGLEVPLGSAEPIDRLASALNGRGRCLVVLDNFEQVTHLARDTLGRWLDRAPGATFLVTTRHVLGLPGEVVVELAALSRAESTALFTSRARSALAAFRPTVEDHSAIERLAELLEGLPLAIELAAARVRLMTPRQLLERMRDRFRLLAGGSGRHERQSTLRHAFDWSWDLLSDVEKAALAQLSIFEGGFTLQAAEAVLHFRNEDVWPLDVIQGLVERSLVRRVDGDRLSLFQSVKEYAAEHLSTPGRFDGSGQAALQDAEARHWRFFATLDERAVVASGSSEIENLVAACRRACERGDQKSASMVLVAAWTALRMTGPFRVALELASKVASLAGLGIAEGAAVDWVSGGAAYLLGEVGDARARLSSGLTRARLAGASDLEARLLCALGELKMTTGELMDAEADLHSALRIAQSLADARLEFRARNGMGALAIERGRAHEGREQYEAALGLARRLADKRWEGGLLSNLGALLYGEGRLDEARVHYEQALALARSVGDRRWEGSARSNLALLQHETGLHIESREQFLVALRLARELGHAALECTVLCNLGLVSQALDEFDPALEYYRRAVDRAVALEDRRSEGQFRGFMGLLLAKMGRTHESRHCLAAGEALLRAGSDELSLGIFLCCLSRAAVESSDREAAKAALAEADGILVRSGASESSELGRAIARARAEIRMDTQEGSNGRRDA